MGTLTIQDLPDEVLEHLDAAATAANRTRSQQAGKGSAVGW